MFAVWCCLFVWCGLFVGQRKKRFWLLVLCEKMPQNRAKNALKRPPNSCREKGRVHKKARGKHKREEKKRSKDDRLLNGLARWSLFVRQDDDDGD
jgi:hypothetical protein